MEIRPFRSQEEYRRCEDLQRQVWGPDFSELAPASLQEIAVRLGGVASGAFTGSGELVGFVFGLTGPAEGRLLHWSHMLAVLPSHRGRGVGVELKLHQRGLLRERGVEVARWSFDPLVARNAHFNLNRLGARVVEYVRDMYGETGSELHRGLGTDRFVVEWDLTAPLPGEEAAERGRETRAERGRETPAEPSMEAELARVDVPADVMAVRDRDPAEAAAWRERTREALVPRLEAGWRVAAFVPGEERGHYLLAPPAADGGEPQE